MRSKKGEKSKRLPNIPSAAYIFSVLDSKNAEEASSLDSAGMSLGRSPAASVYQTCAVEFM